MASSQPWTPGTGGAQPPVRGSVATVPWIGRQPWEPLHRGDVPDSHRPPPFGLLAEAAPQQPRAGNRPVSEARPALRTDNRETSGYVVETECGRPPPTGTTAIRGKHSTVPCVFTPGLHGLPALSGVLTPPCVTVRPGMSAFSRNLYFLTGRTNPPSAQIRGRGPELPLNRHGHVLSSVCLALTPSRRHRGVDRQKVADIAAWGRTAGPCLGAD